MKNSVTQHQQVIEVMEENGGFATLGHLYQHVDISDWKTKTPFKTINRIAQDNRFFFKIRPVLWALKSKEKEVLSSFSIEKPKDKIAETFSHSYFQGLLLEIGNLSGLGTFGPNQDKNRQFLSKPLGEVSTVKAIYPFSYDPFINRAKTVDVIWFNDRKMPTAFFEVEHSTDIFNSLIKFADLTDFHSRFVIVADVARRREFDSKLTSTVFMNIKDRFSYLTYEQLSELHTRTHMLTKSLKKLPFLNDQF